MNATAAGPRRRRSADFRFFTQWLRRPGAVGSIVPTGKATSRAMASFVPLDSDLPVLELGPGTGVVTRAIIEHGVSPERIVSIEYSREFYDFLSNEFPHVNFIHGDAFDLDATLKGSPWQHFCAVISCLPLLNFPRPQRLRLVEDCLKRIDPGSPVTQLCYGPRAPVPAKPGSYTAEPTEWVTKNVPPARLFVYRSTGSG